MSDQMDIDRSAPRPRDPRLSNQPNRPQPPSPPVRPGSVDSRRKSSVASPATQNYSPIVPGNQTQKHGDRLIRDISDLIRSNVAAAKETSERENVRKKQKTSDGLAQRAAPHVGFPAAANFFQESSKAAGADLKRLDEAIKKHESHCFQLEKSLIANLSSNFLHPPNIEERLKKLESDSEAKFTKLRRDFEEKLSRYRNDSEGRIIKLEYQLEQAKARGPEVKLENVQNRLGQLEGPFRQNTTQQKQARGGVGDNMSYVSGWDKINPHGHDMNGLRKDMTLMKNDIEKLNYDLRPLLPLKDHFSSVLDDMNKAILLQNEKLDAIQASRARADDHDNRLNAPGPSKGSSENVSNDAKAMLEDVISRVQNVEAHIAKYPHPSANLDGILDNLSEQITHLQSLQDMRDDIEGSEINEVKKSLAQQTEALNSLKDDHGRVSDQLGNVVNNITTSNSELSQGVAGLRQNYDNAARHIETLTISVHSLETRYNNLNTEPMVRNMLAAMQELYPSAAQLTEQVTRLKFIFDREWPALKTAVDQLTKAHTEHVGDISRLRQDLDKLSESVKSHHDTSKSSLLDSGNVSARFNALDHKTNILGQWMESNRKQLEDQIGSKEITDTDIMQKFDALKQNIDGLAQWINDHGKSLEQKLESTETSEAIQELNEKHNILVREAEKVTGQISSLATFFDQNKQMPQELNDLINRVSDIEKSISNIQSNNNASTTEKSNRDEVSSLQKRVRELEAAWGTETSYAEDISALQKRFEGLEQTTSADDHALWTEFGKLRDLFDNPKSSGQKAEEFKPQQKENSPLVETPSNSKRPKSKDSSTESTKLNFMDMAEINPAQALREKKKKNKKKRPHSPSVHEGSSVQFPSSPGGLSSAEGSSVVDPEENKGEKPKKKKKRKTQEKAVSVE